MSAKKYVCNQAKIECQMCTNPNGTLMVTSNMIKLQGKLWATEKDKEKTNLMFQGTCKASPHQSIPCIAVMQTGQWQGTGDITIQGSKPLLESSTIICNYGGAMIKIKDDMQKSQPSSLVPTAVDGITPYVPVSRNLVSASLENDDYNDVASVGDDGASVSDESVNILKPFGYEGKDGNRVNISLNNGMLEYSNNISNDLKILIDLINQSCSSTLKNQIIETSNSFSKIEVIITDELSDCCFGVHQAYDKNGNLLEWDNSKDDFNGTPSYVDGLNDSYERVLITVYRKNLEISCTALGCGNSQFSGFKLSFEESMIATFGHESHHNTDKEFIQDLKNRREGKYNRNIDPHKNIDPRENLVWFELDNCN